MSVTNLHNLPEKVWDRVIFYLAEDDRRNLGATSKAIFKHLSCALWKIAIYQRPIAAKMWNQMGDIALVEAKIVCLFRRFELAILLKQQVGRNSQSQSDSCGGNESWLEDFLHVGPGEFQRLCPLPLRRELDTYQAHLTDADLLRAAVRKGELEWVENFDLSEIEMKTIDEMALISLNDYSGSLIFERLLPYTSVYKEKEEKKASDMLTRLIARAAIKGCSAEFELLTHLNRPFFHGEVLTVLAKKNLVPEIRMLLGLDGIKINKEYVVAHESQLGVVSSNGLHAAILEASLAGSFGAVKEMLAHFPDSIPYNILRHARDLLRKKADEKFEKEERSIYENGYNRLYKYLPVPDQWKRASASPDHQRICQLLCKEIYRRFPNPTLFQDECLSSRKLPLKEDAVIMINIFVKK